MKQHIPPSLSRISGKSDSQLREEQIIRHLCRAISDLSAKQSPPDDPEEAAHYPYSGYLLVSVFAAQEKKRGCASPASVCKQLKQIRSGADTLAGRLKAADLNVFEALRLVSEDREAAKEEWLQLKVLLETMSDRAKRASRAAESVLKVWPTRGTAGRKSVEPTKNRFPACELGWGLAHLSLRRNGAS